MPIKYYFWIRKLSSKPEQSLINTMETLHDQFHWLRRFTEFRWGGTCTRDAECSGRPKEVVTPEIVDKIPGRSENKSA